MLGGGCGSVFGTFEWLDWFDFPDSLCKERRERNYVKAIEQEEKSLLVD